MARGKSDVTRDPEAPAWWAAVPFGGPPGSAARWGREDVGQGPYRSSQKRPFWRGEPQVAEEVMTAPVKTLREDALVRDAAELMRTEDVGAVAVVTDDDRLVGMVTDRDLVMRAFGREQDANLRVRDVMTDELVVVGPEEPIDHVVGRMRYHLLQRLPVVDRRNRLLGIISLEDVARRSRQSGEVRRTAASFAERGPHEPWGSERGGEGWGERGGGWGEEDGSWAMAEEARNPFGRAAPGRWHREPLTARELMHGPAKVVPLGTSLPEVVALMRRERVGILPVVDQDQRLKGVITDRDILVRVTSAERTQAAIPVEDVMTTRLETVGPDDPISTIVNKMSRRAVHRLPVVEEDGVLLGMVSIDDVAQRADYDEEVREVLAKMANRRSFWRRLASWGA